MISFFMGLAIASPTTFTEFVKVVAVSQLVVILTPAALMTVMLTRSPKQTLLLKWPVWWTLPAAVALAVALDPVVRVLGIAVQQLYPISPGAKAAQESMQHVLKGASLGSIILLFGITPAICEEVAFRGFILSGFRHFGHKWRAIVLSSIFFAITHWMFQQSIIACLVGAIIAYIAVQTGSIFPGMLFHFTHNSLQFLFAEAAADSRLDKFFKQLPNNDYIYSWWVFGVGATLAVWLLYKFSRLGYQRTDEETLQEAIDHQMIEVNA